MNTKDFRQLSEICIDKVRKICTTRGLKCIVLQPEELMRGGVDPGTNDVILIEDEAYLLFNNGNEIYYKLMGKNNHG